VKTGSPAELTTLIKTEIAKWAKVAKAANLKLD
jgi:tripartite-type tricarboxylate transporter receptor subunit TctC